MIIKVHLNVNDELKPAILEWDDDKSDYVLSQIPDGITRTELEELNKEVCRITNEDMYREVYED